MDGWYLKECNMLTEKDYKEFISLVKKMREAQIECEIVKTMLSTKKKEDVSDELRTSLLTAESNAVFYEDKVDEYLEKMEV